MELSSPFNDLYNIRIMSAIIYFCYTEKFTNRFYQIFIQNLMGLSLVYGQPFHKTYMNIGLNLLRYPGDRQINR